MSTLGQQISELLRAHGVPGPIMWIEGGPGMLKVTYYRLNEQGQKFFDEDGNIAVSTIAIDLHAAAVTK